MLQNWKQEEIIIIILLLKCNVEFIWRTGRKPQKELSG
jgi:hypothetical protein